MKRLRALGLVCSACATLACAQEEFLDRLGETLSVTAFDAAARARLSGALDLEGYSFRSPSPGLIDARGHALFNPRLAVFLDAQLGRGIYFFAESRLDRGFDPSDARVRARLDEYALRFTPWNDGRLSVQVGKFATVVGSWVARHGSWENPFVTAPLAYENLTGVWDTKPPPSLARLLEWAHVRLGAGGSPGAVDWRRRLPILWGPSYASGAAVSGRLGKISYAAELKNAALSSRPATWVATRGQWTQPTFSGRLGYRPDARWHFGASASAGSFLRLDAAPVLPAGRTARDYREAVLAQDLGFAWHHWQLWAEIFEARFELPGLATARTVSYYAEAKYKFTPQLFGAVRWNQQLFGTVPDGAGRTDWGRNAWRVDVAPGYRFTPHLQLKLQYTLQRGDHVSSRLRETLATQLTARF